VKHGYIADVHLHNHPYRGGETIAGINDRARATLRALRSACEAAHDVGCKDLTILGDLFDTTKPIPQLIKEAQDALEDWLPTKVVMGNHDRNSATIGDHALGPLEPVSDLIFVPSISNATDVLYLPFNSAPVMSWFEKEVAHWASASLTQLNVICAHFGLHDADFRKRNPWAEACADAAPVEEIMRVMEKFDVKALFAGNWHAHRRWTSQNDGPPHIVQVGALCPTGFDNPGLEDYGKLVIYDDGAVSSITIPGPRFITIKREEDVIPHVLMAQEGRHQLYLRWPVSSEYVLSATEGLRAVQDQYPDTLVSFEVLPDQRVTKVRAHAAAAAARSGKTLQLATEEYVQRMELPDGVRRERVLDLTKKFLNL